MHQADQRIACITGGVHRRGYVGTFHHFSTKHMGRYIDEFSTRHNRRERDTIAHINQSIRNFEGILGYKNLIAG